MAVGGGAGALAAAWREDTLESALLGGGSWLAEEVVGGWGEVLFFGRLVERLETDVAEDLE